MRIDLRGNIEAERKAACLAISEAAAAPEGIFATHPDHRREAYREARAFVAGAGHGPWLLAEQLARTDGDEKPDLQAVAEELLNEEARLHAAASQRHAIVRKAELKIAQASTITDIQNTLSCVLSQLNGGP